MNTSFEVQLIDSVANAKRKRSNAEASAALLNQTVLVIAFFSLAIGYALNSIPHEAAVEAFNNASAAKSSEWTSLAEHLSQVPKSIGDLLGG